jgi:hypothetical protein
VNALALAHTLSTPTCDRGLFRYILTSLCIAHPLHPSFVALVYRPRPRISNSPEICRSKTRATNYEWVTPSTWDLLLRVEASAARSFEILHVLHVYHAIALGHFGFFFFALILEPRFNTLDNALVSVINAAPPRVVFLSLAKIVDVFGIRRNEGLIIHTRGTLSNYYYCFAPKVSSWRLLSLIP